MQNATQQVRAAVAQVMAKNNIAYAYSVRLAKSPATGRKDLRVVTVRGWQKNPDLAVAVVDGIKTMAYPAKVRVDLRVAQ